jgi:hypothetical protein
MSVALQELRRLVLGTIHYVTLDPFSVMYYNEGGIRALHKASAHSCSHLQLLGHRRGTPPLAPPLLPLPSPSLRSWHASPIARPLPTPTPPYVLCPWPCKPQLPSITLRTVQEKGVFRLDLTGSLGAKVNDRASYQWIAGMDHRGVPLVRGERNYQRAGRGCLPVAILHTTEKTAIILENFLRRIVYAAVGVNGLRDVGGSCLHCVPGGVGRVDREARGGLMCNARGHSVGCGL